MAKRWWLAAGLAFTMAGCSSPRDAASVMGDAQQAMGNVNSIQYSGTGMNAFFGQALTAGEEWPRREMSSYTRAINYEQRSAREEMNFAQPTFGGQQQNTQVNGDKAWNVGPNGPAPQLAAAEERQLLHLAHPARLRASRHGCRQRDVVGTEGASVISFTALGKYKVDGTIDAQNHVTRVETKIANPVMGDTDVVADLLRLPGFQRRPVSRQDPRDRRVGFRSGISTITSVTPNAPLDLPVPDAVASATVPAVQTMSTKLADGVWHITGGSHHSVLVEFNDHLAVVEAPLDEARSLAVLAEAKKLAPTKPVRYVLTTHHHFDHSGGLRTYVAEGATVVTHQSNVPYFEKTLAAPATISPDAQSKAAKKPMLQGVSDKEMLTDGKQTIEVYATSGDTHTKEYTLVYLPGPRILVEGDAYSPGPADAPVPATPPPNAVALHDEIQRLKLNVATIAPIHGRGAVPIAELRKFIGRR